MTYQDQKPRPDLRWDGQSQTQTQRPASAPGGAFERFIGGSPAAVFMRLLVVSLIVGALLMWLDIRPWDIFRAVERLFNRLWMLGFDAVREIVAYVVAGAAIVVPVWIVLRLLNMRGAR